MSAITRAQLFAATTAFALLIVVGADRAHAKSTIPSKECSALVENRSDCKSTMTTFPPPSTDASPPPNTAVTALASNSPVAVRVAPAVKVTVVVHKRPLELIQSQLTCNQVAKPDVLGTLVSQLGKPLGGLTLWAGVQAPHVRSWTWPFRMTS